MSEHFPEVIGWNSVVLYTVQYTCTAVHLRNEVRVELPSKVQRCTVVQRTEVLSYFRTKVSISIRKYESISSYESTLKVRK